MKIGLNTTTNRIKSKAIVILSFCLLMYLFGSTVSFAFGLNIVFLNYSISKYIPFLIFLMSVFFNCIVSRHYKDSIITFSSLFALYILIRIGFGYFLGNVRFNLVESLFQSLSWYACFYCAFSLSRQKQIPKELSILSLLAMIAFTLVYLCEIKGIDYANSLRPMAVNSVYYAISLLPFTLLFKSNILKLFSFLLCVGIIVFSAKATPLISLLFSSLVLIFVSSNKYKNVIILITIPILIVVLIVFRNAIFGSDVVEKILSVNETGAVGRLPIYQNVIKTFFSRPFINILFGNGYYGAYTFLGNSAHNDFLEVMFDFGLVGVALYFSFYLMIGIRIVKGLKKRLPYSKANLMVYILVLIISLTSELIFIPRYYLFMIFFIGLSLGSSKVILYEKNRHINIP